MNDDGHRALAAWLSSHVDGVGDVRILDAGKPSSGYSAETTILTAACTTDGVERTERFVLRKETPEPPVYPVQAPGLATEIEIQYRVMEAIASSPGVPIAPLHGFEPDVGVVGAPFFVMGFVDGEVPIESPSYALEGWFTELAPASRAAMLDDGLRRLAAVHAVDWKDAGLGWLLPDDAAPTVARQLDLWTAYAERELDGREHPALDTALRWLRATMPEPSDPALCWGDPRPGNAIWRDDRAACLTDFEAAAIAPPEIDLGWWLMFDRWSHESSEAERLPGEPTRDEQRTAYERHAGRVVGDTTWYEVFAAARYAAIVLRVMNRLVARGDMPADQTFWRDTNVTTCLRDLLDVVGA